VNTIFGSSDIRIQSYDMNSVNEISSKSIHDAIPYRGDLHGNRIIKDPGICMGGFMGARGHRMEQRNSLVLEILPVTHLVLVPTCYTLQRVLLDFVCNPKQLSMFFENCNQHTDTDEAVGNQFHNHCTFSSVATPLCLLPRHFVYYHVSLSIALSLCLLPRHFAHFLVSV